jgi:NitT/TauT family transport system ATP-binding protein
MSAQRRSPVIAPNGENDASALISVRDLTKTYSTPDGGTFTALKDVSLDIGENEFVSLLGPSGCGKTTLLKLIGNIIATDVGKVLIDGRPVPKVSYDIGFVFQEAGLLPWQDVETNIALGLAARGVDPSSRRATAREYAELVGLGKFGKYYPHQLSGGMQQRAGLARALAIKPRVLLMDEPFAALDAMTRTAMQTELARIWETLRTTVVFVTHSIDEAIFLSDRIIVFDANPGRIVEVFDVDLPRPRRHAEVAKSEAVRDLTPRIIELLGGHVGLEG